MSLVLGLLYVFIQLRLMLVDKHRTRAFGLIGTMIQDEANRGIWAPMESYTDILDRLPPWKMALQLNKWSFKRFYPTLHEWSKS